MRAKQTPMLVDKAWMRNRIWNLRFKDRMSMRQIGEEIGVSHQRINQLLKDTGGTGGRKVCIPYADTLQDPEWLSKHARMTSTQLAIRTGFPRESVAYYRGKAHMRFLPESPEHRLAYEWENAIALMIEQRGHQPELTTYGYSYDILVNGHLRIDIKAARTLWQYSAGAKSKHARFRIRHKINTCDIYICVIALKDEEPAYFIIPCKQIRNSPQMLYINWPPIQPKKKSYVHFQDRWDLLDEAAQIMV